MSDVQPLMGRSDDGPRRRSRAAPTAALCAGETTPAQSVLAISVLLLAVGAVLTPVIGLRRRKP